MAIQQRSHHYRHGDVELEACVAWDDTADTPRPGVLVSHAWRGRSEFEDNKAVELARLGYTGFALDLYGKGVLGSNPAENAALMQPFLDDREMLGQRLELAVAEAAGLPEVAAGRLAAIGFCFGGLCVLDLARRNAALCGVASFHGLLAPPATTADDPIRPAILALHGWDDPLAPPADVTALAAELTARAADWQLLAFGGTAHAFTNPAAADPDNGLVFSPRAADRAWALMRSFLDEKLAE